MPSPISGTTTGRMSPRPNATCAITAYSTAAPSPTASATNGRSHRLRSSGRSVRPSAISTSATPPESCSGIPRISVSMALAWISGPAISPAGHDVGWRSCSTGATAPMTTILSRNEPGLKVRFTARENGT